MRTLYFDIDGTLLRGTCGQPKPALAGGALERALRAAGFERLVCVGNVVHIVRALERASRAVDGLGQVFKVCQGTFEDERWFRAVTTLVDDPEARARAIDTTLDWYWADDLAAQYCALVARDAFFDEHRGGRILAPKPDSDGRELLDWLARASGVGG
jgi:hypothetical protein